MQILMFSKMLKNVGGYSIEKTAQTLANMGFDGIDLTVRPGGHVLPEEVEKGLPEAVKIAESKGLTVPMITTGVVDAEDDYSEQIFASAEECNVEYLKLGYWHYEGFGKIKSQIDFARKKLEGIEKLCQKYNVCAAIHIHSGDCLSASPAVVYMLLDGFNPKYLGAYIDPGHMAVEGGKSVWKIGMDLLSDKIKMVSIKDFGWFNKGDKNWKSELVPLDQGLVRWNEVFKYLKQISFDGCLSVHSEYGGLNIHELIEQTRKDLAYIKEILKREDVSK